MSEVKRLWVESGYISATQAGARFVPATADEIKAAHPKCATCDYLGEADMHGEQGCIFVASELYGYKVDPLTDYCRHHTPMEAQG